MRFLSRDRCGPYRMGRGGAMHLICMCPSHIPDPVLLLWKEGGGKNERDVMPSKVTGLSQVLELFNIRILVSCEGAKALFYLGKISKGKGETDPHSAFYSSHFPERVDGNQLTRGSVRVSVCGADGVLWFWVGRRMGARVGGRSGRRRGGGKGRRRGRSKGGKRGGG
jgi:hypothetical protein